MTNKHKEGYYWFRDSNPVAQTLYGQVDNWEIIRIYFEEVFYDKG